MTPISAAVLVVLALFCGPARAAGPAARAAELEAVRADVARILAAAGLPPGSVVVERRKNGVELGCGPGKLRVVAASQEEWAPAAYFGLRKLGFLFPHPRRQISPTPAQLARRCRGAHAWAPRLARRGFHLHTQHPGEWTAGFLSGRGAVAEDTVRWLARNGQNLLQVKALRAGASSESLRRAFALARRLGLTTGLELSLASSQQKAYRLVDAPLPLVWLAALAPRRLGARAAARAGALHQAVGFDYASIELGSSEFTAIPRAATLGWLEDVRRALEARGAAVFVKIHASSNQGDPDVGNHNFLPRLAAPSVGVLPHTVMFYGLDDPAPVYGRKDFADMKAFLLAEKSRRPTWYFPETSYFVGIDIDVPLLLTDYLVARSADLDLLEREGVEGQVVFSTGQELGYWLMDWTCALLVSQEARGAPWIGLELLGEDVGLWRRILDYQTRFIKRAGLLPALSSSNLMDELPFFGRGRRVLARHTMRELERDPAALEFERSRLAAAAAAIPDVSGVKDEELRLLLEVTFGRVRHALALRRALAHPKGSQERQDAVAQARAVRELCLGKVRAVAGRYSRYPEAGVFERGAGLTSYAYGYGWPAVTLHFWEREERIVAEGRRSPFFMNLYDPVALLF